MPDTATPPADVRARLWEFVEQCEAQAGPELTVPADGARQLALDLRVLLAHATTPGDDRGRELAAGRVRAYLDAVEGWRPDAVLVDEHNTGEQLRIADLRALAVPAETGRVMSCGCPFGTTRAEHDARIAAPAETEAGDLPALYWSPTAGLITGAIHDQWSSIDGDDPDALPADARWLTFAATPPAPGPPQTEAEDGRKFLTELLDTLDGAGCVFWACQGSDEPYEDMVTCRVCATVRSVRARLAATPPAPEGEAGLIARATARLDTLRGIEDAPLSRVVAETVRAVLSASPPAPAGPQAEGETETGGAS